MPRSKNGQTDSQPTVASAQERAAIPQQHEAALILRGRTHVVRKGVEYLSISTIYTEKEQREQAMAALQAQDDPIELNVGEGGFSEAHSRAVQRHAEQIEAARAQEAVMRIHDSNPMKFEVPTP